MEFNKDCNYNMHKSVSEYAADKATDQETCASNCAERADLQGLKVLRNGTSNTVLVYMWH